MSTILIADDDPVMVKLLEFNLRRAGHATLVCREGLSVAERAREARPDLLILDVMLPGRSGLEVLRDFRADAALASLPVIVVTSQGKDSTQEELIEAGARVVFTKPFSPTLLLAQIAQLLAPAAAKAPTAAVAGTD